MITTRSKGFTLIELLVVIAIIGVLSAVVLASLNTARSKGNDASIKSNLDTIRTQSAIFYDTNNGYGSGNSALGPNAAACGLAGTASLLNDSNVLAAMIQADKAAGGTATGSTTITRVYCGYSAGMAAWVVFASTTNNLSGNNVWCVDSTGVSKNSPGNGITTACN